MWRRPLKWNLNGMTEPRDGSVDHLSLKSLRDRHGPIRAPKSLAACVVTALVVRLTPSEFFGCIGKTLRQVRLAVFTVMLIIGLAYLMNYSGLAYTLGKAVASTGYLFILLSPFLGWVAVMLSGSDTSGNALFGNLQVVAARQLNLNPILFAATNSSGGVMGKMISPQNIATGV